MRIKIVHIDATKREKAIPNLALMRISAYFKSKGAEIDFTFDTGRGLWDYDFVFGSNLFTDTFSRAVELKRNYPNAVIGGYAWDKENGNPTPTTLLGFHHDLQHFPGLDYDLYGIDYSIGYLQRGCRMSQVDKNGVAKPMAEQHCKGCPVPFLEGKPHDFKHITDVWRGDGYPKKIFSLDNDFFSNPFWEENLRFVRDNGFEISVTQAFNARLLSDAQAKLFSEVKFMATGFNERRIYLAWDITGDEKTFFRGVDRLLKYGVKPRQICVYFLIGKAGETWERDVWYRFQKIVNYGRTAPKWNGLVPYPMVLDNQDQIYQAENGREYSLKQFQRWVLRKIYQSKNGADFDDYNPNFKPSADERYDLFSCV